MASYAFAQDKHNDFEGRMLRQRKNFVGVIVINVFVCLIAGLGIGCYFLRKKCQEKKAAAAATATATPKQSTTEGKQNEPDGEVQIGQPDKQLDQEQHYPKLGQD